jgi:hypothetical protein
MGPLSGTYAMISKKNFIACSRIEEMDKNPDYNLRRVRHGDSHGGEKKVTRRRSESFYAGRQGKEEKEVEPVTPP